MSVGVEPGSAVERGAAVPPGTSVEPGGAVERGTAVSPGTAVEPVRGVEPIPPVRWGTRRWRYGVGLTLIVLGAAVANLTSTFSLLLAAIGPGLQLVGWLVLPGALWRRLVVILPCLAASLVLLGGPDFAGAFAVLLGGWLFARHRPPVSYLALLPVILLSFVLKAVLTEYSQNWIALVSCTAATLVCAWLGWALAMRRRRRVTVRRAARDRPAVPTPVPAPTPRAAASVGTGADQTPE